MINSSKKNREKYIGTSALQELVPMIQEHIKRRNIIFEKYDFDIHDSGDAISNILSWDIISQYDPEFEPNFHRNGVDAKDGSELKYTRVNVPKVTKTGKLSKASRYNATWTFHAVSDYSHRWIFIAGDRKTSEIVRIYDISDPNSVSIIINHLEEQRQKYLEKYNIDKVDVTKIKNDRIGISEKFIRNYIPFITNIIGSCEVMKG